MPTWGCGAPAHELERLGIPANYIVRLKQEQSSIRQHVLRAYYLQRIRFLPSASTLVKTVVTFTIVLLLLTDVRPRGNELLLLGFIFYLYVYLLKLIHIMSTPFLADEHTMDDVSLFLLRELSDRIQGPAVQEHMRSTREQVGTSLS